MMVEGRIYSFLKKRLISLDIPPNVPLHIGELCESMSVSHIPMREALACLALEGWVHHVPNRGYFSRQIDAQTIIDCYECLEVVIGRGLELGQLDPSGGPSLDTLEPEGLFNHLNHAVQSVQNRFLKRQGTACLGQVRFITEALWHSAGHREAIQSRIDEYNRLLGLEKRSEAKASLKEAFRERIVNVGLEIGYATEFKNKRLL